ncbi:MAG: FtsX-like permease family protein [Acidimicrobiales bacterium]
MSAVWAWVWIDLRGRGRSLAVLALLVALTTGVVLTATAGARRGGTVVDRLVERTLPATVAALPNEAGFDWAAVEQLPNVAAIARFPVSQFYVKDLPGEAVNFAYSDDAMIDIERPVVLEGRLTDPSRDDEAVITKEFESSFGKGVGDTVTIQLLTPEQVDESYLSAEAPPPEGPEIETTIVGIVRSPWFSDTEGAGTLIPSNGLFDQHAANLIGNTEVANINALVRLDGGAKDVPGFREDLAELTGRRDIEFFDLAAMGKHASDVAGFEASALLAFAAAALIAAVFLVGQSVVRYVAGATQDLQVLAAVGLRPRHVRMAATAGPAVAAIAGAAAGVVGAWLASSRFPTGTAAPLEPAPGRHADLSVLLPGLVLIPLVVVVGAVAASWVASRSFGVARRTRRSSVAGLLARAGMPVPLTVGASFALDRGRGSQSVPVLPALLGAVVGVLGVVGALTFAAGVDDAAAHPERFGQVSELQAFLGFNGEDFVPTDDVLPIVADDPDVAAVNDTRQGVLESGRVDLAAFVMDPVDAPLPIVVLDGRLPSQIDEVAIATQSAKDLGATVGDRVELSGSRGSGTYLVTGVGFVPEGSHNGYDEGAWVLPGTYDELIEGFKFHTAEVSLRDGADREAVVARLGVSVADALGVPPEETEGFISERMPPSRLAELRQVQRLPLLLAAFLALLAVAAVGHAVATAVRRRRHDLAVLRALGVTRRQSRAIVLIQGTVLAAVGLTFGVPLGFAIGRTLWRSVADTTPVEYIPPVAAWALVLVGPVALLAAILLAAWPSQRAASMRVAQVLRTE